MILPKLTGELLLIRVEKEETTKAGLTLPESYVEEKLINSSSGIVESAGPDADIPVGSEVVYKSFVGNKIEPKGDDGKAWHIIVAQNDVLCFYPMSKVKN